MGNPTAGMLVQVSQPHVNYCVTCSAADVTGSESAEGSEEICIELAFGGDFQSVM